MWTMIESYICLPIIKNEDIAICLQYGKQDELNAFINAYVILSTKQSEIWLKIIPLKYIGKQ